MNLSSPVALRAAVSVAAFLIVSACTDDGRPTPLSGVELVAQAPEGRDEPNVNIDNPTLQMPATFGASPGEMLTLVWSDEFDGDLLDPASWFFATGDGTEKGLPGGWGNNELQYYLPDSAQLGNGVLRITARQETIGGLNYTSARINTEDRFAFKYGRIEASIKLPAGQGLWPAFWMLPQDTTYGVWAASGEIDIVETVNLDGSGSDEIFGTLHFGGEFPANSSAGTTYTPSADITSDFHTYALEWDETEIRWYFDDTLYAVQNSWSSTAAPFPAPFDEPFHIILNLAVGGNFPGSPDGTTVFPAVMDVDWVRVYSGEEGSVIVTPADPGTIPDVVLFASDEAADLVFGVDYTALDPFGSGSVFNATNTSDADFSPAFSVTTGNGYTAQVGQLGYIGFATGFASTYASLDFKIKNINNDLVRVKFNDNGDYLDLTLTSSAFSTSLGNGWYQVSIPLTNFTGVDTATALLFETDNTAASAFTFLMTDIGFSGTASTGGGGGGGGTGGGGSGGIAVNGGFETGDFSGWEMFSGGGIQEVITVNPSSGTFAANLNVPVRALGDPAVDNLIKNSNLEAGNLTPGATITISFDMRGSLSGAGGVVFVEFFSELTGGGTSKAEILSGGPLIPVTAWTSYSFTTTLGPDVSGGVTLQLKTSCGPVEGCGVDAFFDNVSLVIQ